MTAVVEDTLVAVSHIYLGCLTRDRARNVFARAIERSYFKRMVSRNRADNK